MVLKDYLTFSKNFQRVGDKRHAKKKKKPSVGGLWMVSGEPCLSGNKGLAK